MEIISQFYKVFFSIKFVNHYSCDVVIELSSIKYFSALIL